MELLFTVNAFSFVYFDMVYKSKDRISIELFDINKSKHIINPSKNIDLFVFLIIQCFFKVIQFCA